MSQSGHLTTVELLVFMNDGNYLPEGDAAAAHLQGCKKCREELLQLAKDSLLLEQGRFQRTKALLRADGLDSEELAEKRKRWYDPSRYGPAS